MLKIVVSDLKAYQAFLNLKLMRGPGIVSVRSVVCLSMVKSTTSLPIDTQQELRSKISVSPTIVGIPGPSAYDPYSKCALRIGLAILFHPQEVLLTKGAFHAIRSWHMADAKENVS